MDYTCGMIVKQTEPFDKKKRIPGTGSFPFPMAKHIHFFPIRHIHLFQYAIVVVNIKYKPSASKFQWQKEKNGLKARKEGEAQTPLYFHKDTKEVHK